jgi:hypothetical protein
MPTIPTMGPSFSLPCWLIEYLLPDAGAVEGVLVSAGRKARAELRSAGRRSTKKPSDEFPQCRTVPRQAVLAAATC